MSFLFETTASMVRYLTDTARTMMLVHVFDSEDSEDGFKLPSPRVLVLSVANGPNEVRENLDAISRGDIRIPSIIVDIFEPLALFGHSMNLVRSFRIKFPGMMETSTESYHPVPIETSVRQDDIHSYIASYHLVKTIKGSCLDENGVCPGDRLVLMVRVKPHLLFGLIVHMALMLEKDVEAFYSDVTIQRIKD